MCENTSRIILGTRKKPRPLLRAPGTSEKASGILHSALSKQGKRHDIASKAAIGRPSEKEGSTNASDELKTACFSKSNEGPKTRQRESSALLKCLWTISFSPKPAKTNHQPLEAALFLTIFPSHDLTIR